jgi:single-strand DNA-binding protein
MNQVQVTGRLVKDPEMRQLRDGRPVCTVRLAVEGMGRGNEVGYIDATEFGAAAAASGRTLKQGWLVAVSGRVDFREWDTDGQHHSAHGIVGRIEFLSPPRSQQPAAEQVPAPIPQYLSPPRPPAAEPALLHHAGV